MENTISIAPYSEIDRDAVTSGLIDEQEVERAVADTRLPGKDIAPAYLEHLLASVAANSGAFFVAKKDGKVAGFLVCWVEREDNVAETPASNTYGYISDAWTNPEYRKQGVFRALEKAALDHFKKFKEIELVRLNVLAANTMAIPAYENTGYALEELKFMKKLR